MKKEELIEDFENYREQKKRNYKKYNEDKRKIKDKRVKQITIFSILLSVITTVCFWKYEYIIPTGKETILGSIVLYTFLLTFCSVAYAVALQMIFDVIGIYKVKDIEDSYFEKMDLEEEKILNRIQEYVDSLEERKEKIIGYKRINTEKFEMSLADGEKLTVYDKDVVFVEDGQESHYITYKRVDMSLDGFLMKGKAEIKAYI